MNFVRLARIDCGSAEGRTKTDEEREANREEEKKCQIDSECFVIEFTSAHNFNL